MGKRNAAAAIVDADLLQQFETPPKRMKHGPASTAAVSGGDSLRSPNTSATEFSLSKEFVDGTQLMDLTLKQWRIGKPIGKGSFGEIFLASDDIDKPVTSENAMYVVKIEPHSNGPLFVEIHCLLNTAKRSESCHIPPGMPEYIASGSHMFKNERYRFLILKRYERDLRSLIKNKRVNPKSIPVIACQILDVLEHLHDQGYVHSDIKAENLMIGKVTESSTTLVQNGEFAKSMVNSRNGIVQHQRSNGIAVPEGGKGARVVKKVTTTMPSLESASNGAHFFEHGLYQHQEQEMGGRSRNLRPLKTVTYRDLSDEEDRGKIRTGGSGGAFGSKATASQRKRNRKKNEDAPFSCSISPRKNGYEELKAAAEVAHWNELHHKQQLRVAGLQKADGGTDCKPSPVDDRIHLIDFGLASKFMDSSGQHRPFCMDQRRAHDGTLEFTSRDAHMGAHARRSDLECLGYNLVYWSRGFLPWKDEKLLNQPEQVHRMKEYFMTDVREMLRLIYGDDCPAYLGDFLAYVGQLTYDDRPDYQYCRSLFHKELKRLGCPVGRSGQPLRLDVDAIELLSESLTAQDEAEITNKINHVKSLMKLGALFPYRDSTVHSKASSPKNLRSKRGDANGRSSQSVIPLDGVPAVSSTSPTASAIASSVTTRKKEKKFACEDIFATDADQIARDRVEKEFERAEQMEETVIRYTGRPTYAIQELERKMRSSGGGAGASGGLEYTESEDYIKGYTKPMMDILRKRQSQLFREIQEANETGKNRGAGSARKGMEGMPKSPINKGRSGDSDEKIDGLKKEEEEEEEDEVSETEDAELGQEAEVNNDEEEDEEDVAMEEMEKKLKRHKYYHDEDYDQQAEEVEEEEEEEEEEEDEEEEDEEDDDEEEEGEDEGDDKEELEAEEEDEEEELKDDQCEEATPAAVINGYEKKGWKHRQKWPKGHKQEDTDSDFFNDGGCEEEEKEESVSEDDDGVQTQDETGVAGVGEETAEEDGEDDDDQQDSDFNDQESITSASDVLIPKKRTKKAAAGRGSSGKRKTANGKASKKGSSGRGRKNGNGVVSDYAGTLFGRKTTGTGERQRRKHLIHGEDDDGDNARQFDGHLQVAAASNNRHITAAGAAVRPSHHHNNNNHCNSKAYYGDVDDSSHDTVPTNGLPASSESKYRYVKRRKSGLRERIRPTDRGNDYQDTLQRKQKAALRNKRRRETAAHLGEDKRGGDLEATLNDESSSCSSSIATTSSSSSSSSSSGNSSTSRSSGGSTSHSIASSSHSGSVSSSASSAVSSRGRSTSQRSKERYGAASSSTANASSSRDSSTRRRGSRSSATSGGKSRRAVAAAAIAVAPASRATGNDASQTRWSRANSNSSRSAATSRSSSVSASTVGGGALEYQSVRAEDGRLHSLPEGGDFMEKDDDDDDTRDVDYAPVCTRRKRKTALASTTVSTGGGSGSLTRRTTSTTTTIRKRNESRGGNGKGTGPASSSSSATISTSSASVADSGMAADQLHHGASMPLVVAAASREEPPQLPAVDAIQQNRGRRYHQHQHYYHVEEQRLHHHHHQHHHPPTMLVRTYSRG